MTLQVGMRVYKIVYEEFIVIVFSCNCGWCIQFTFKLCCFILLIVYSIFTVLVVIGI